jgi:hypothetical protein
MKTPYLIQRATINRPLVKGRLSEAVDLDYMGSAEFEFGALPRSLRAMQAKVDSVKLTVDNRITDNERSLRVLHTFNETEFEEYFKFILRMRGDDLRLKECSRFEANRNWAADTDLWWDIENHVFWSFDKIFMNRLGDCLVASWKYMDSPKD